MLKFGSFCVIGSMLLSHTVRAAEQDSGCHPFANANDVLQCAKERDKSLKVMEADVSIATAGSAAAAQRLNPEFALESVKREKGFSHDISLTHSFDLGDKRGARGRVASAEKDAAVVALRKGKEDVILATVMNLYRLRQLKKELEVVQEGVTTFSQVARQFRRAGALSPEQRISISIFNMALEDGHIREAAILSEKQSVLAEISLAIGAPFEPDLKILPPLKAEWPEMKATSLDSASVALAKTETSVARAGYELQESEAWPDLKFGPKVEVDEDRKTWIGLSLSTPLPLYHRNQGAKSQALAKLNRSEILAEKAADEAQRSYGYLLKSYQELSASLERTIKHGGVETKHSDLHALLNRGVIAAPLITELHRQRQEYYERLHEQELKTIAALWRLYALEGRADKEELK